MDVKVKSIKKSLGKCLSLCLSLFLPMPGYSSCEYYVGVGTGPETAVFKQKANVLATASGDTPDGSLHFPKKYV